MSYKATFNTKELKSTIGLIASISRLYSNVGEANKNSTDDFILLSNRKNKSTITYAKQGVMIKASLSGSKCEDGTLVVDPYILETLPSRAAETTLEVSKSKNDVTMNFINGSSKGSIIVTDDEDVVLSHIPKKENIPDNFVTLSSEHIGRIVSKVLYESTDKRIDKKVGLPVRITVKKNKVCVQTGDSFCGVFCTTKVKDKNKISDVDIMTQGLLLKQIFSISNKSELKFASSEQRTMIKIKTESNYYEVLVPTQELELPNISEWLEKQTKNITTIEADASDIINAVNDACVISNIANVEDPIVSINVKDGVAVVFREEAIGKTTSKIKAKSKKHINIKYNAYWFNQLATKINGVLFIEVLENASIFRDSEGSVKCIVPLMP